AIDVGDGDAPIAAGVRPLRGDESALVIEVEPIGPAAGFMKLGGLAGARIELHDAIADVREVDAAIGAISRPFGELAVGPERFELRVLGDDGLGVNAQRRY